jgi:hypothetical protein
MQSILCFRCLSVRIEKSDPECRVCSGSSSSPTRCCKHQDCCFDPVICCDASLVTRAQSDGPRFTYPIHGGLCLASIPYYAVEADETMCDRARSLARYLSRSRNMLHPRSRQPRCYAVKRLDRRRAHVRRVEALVSLLFSEESSHLIIIPGMFLPLLISRSMSIWIGRYSAQHICIHSA